MNNQGTTFQMCLPTMDSYVLILAYELHNLDSSPGLRCEGVHKRRLGQNEHLESDPDVLLVKNQNYARRRPPAILFSTLCTILIFMEML